MPSEENLRNFSDTEANETAPTADGETSRVDPEGFLFYVALAFVIAVAFYNSLFFGILEPRTDDEASRSFLMYAAVYATGTFIGEGGLLAIAAVLGKGPVWLRMLLVTGVAICWIGTPFLGAPWDEEVEVSLASDHAEYCFPELPHGLLVRSNSALALPYFSSLANRVIGH